MVRYTRIISWVQRVKLMNVKILRILRASQMAKAPVICWESQGECSHTRLQSIGWCADHFLIESIQTAIHCDWGISAHTLISRFRNTNEIWEQWYDFVPRAGWAVVRWGMDEWRERSSLSRIEAERRKLKMCDGMGCAGMDHSGLKTWLDYRNTHAFLRSIKHALIVQGFAWWNSTTIIIDTTHFQICIVQMIKNQISNRSSEWEELGSSLCV